MGMTSFICFYLAIFLGFLMIRKMTKMTIRMRKQELLIVSAIGAQKKDIKKAFYAKSVFVGMISAGISLLLSGLFYLLFYLNKADLLGWMAPAIQYSIAWIFPFILFNIAGSILVEMSSVKRTVKSVLIDTI
ncbi:FtsX-like permease family protein [Isobaculum melis]